ncbi:fumarate reductase (CoM/CoB) subunit TfrA [Methanococcus maripaludis]|uniref:Fumarate reductase/succinate dehydrogenase, flavoprotein subunit n=1 Tax=Methanococcus maripaludis (strain DSM 14266 / JCM 13030 / NBRC 101832 / S2 / LL) TaxID=267377 RepID=Q6LXS1_METMP|nr:fumarate reductase (CoM/CoB) subunit TfrA [Methanococcus maripaludis]CAF30833.1 Fumarate reductase/succinate dehydrogenase, flavoprotein subunit [Methanococcus maripaludis S2]
MITDVLIIGGGGAAARAAIECGQKNVVIASKGLFGKSGCTVMAEGGYNAVLNEKDSFEKHYSDTMKGGGYINDKKLVDVLVKNAPNEFKNLEKFGCIFDRSESAEFAQRPFGGQSFNRTCYSGDRTGHEMIAGLMEYLNKFERIKILEDTMAIKLIVDEVEENGKKLKKCFGAVFLDLLNGDIYPVYAKSTILATGGAGQIYPITSNPKQKVGDGFAIAYREGVELVDMEMVQFHPTGMLGTGILVTEAVRGEGGILYNKNKERFMKNYDSKRMELSTRDVVAKAIYNEIQEGRGIDGGVYLDVTHLEPEVIKEKLETMFSQFKLVGVDIRKEPMKVAPTAHHFMGGIKINEDCETNISGLFACGEVAGGLHGANRLGGNALAETQVFGSIAGRNALNYAEEKIDISKVYDSVEKYIEKLKNTFKGSNSGNNVYSLIDELKNTMWDFVSISRDENGLKTALEKINEIAGKKVLINGVVDFSKKLELENMVLVSKIVINSALLRKESRGAHFRNDYPKTNEECTGNFVAVDGKINFVKIE